MSSKADLMNLHHYKLSCMGLNNISEYSLRDLFIHYVITCTPNEVLGNSKGKSAVSKFLNYFKESKYNKIFKELLVCTYPDQYMIVFTDETKQEIQKEVDYERFDVTILGNILRKCPFFPSAKIQLRRSLMCKSGSHEISGICCNLCDNKQSSHKCNKCGKTTCEGSCCFKTNQPCDHVCNCHFLKSQCRDNSIVCCQICNTCTFCRVAAHAKQCDDGSLRPAIETMINLKNLAISHSTDKIWIQLENGNFESASFPNCKSWEDLCKEVEESFLIILTYLEKHVSDVTNNDVEDRKYYMRGFLNKRNLTKEEMIDKLQHELITAYKRMLSGQIFSSGLKIDFKFPVGPNLSDDQEDLDGELMTFVCSGTSKTLKQESDDKEVFEVHPRAVKFESRKGSEFLRVGVKVVPKTKEADIKIKEYVKTAAEKNKKFRDKLKSEVRRELESGNIDTTVRLNRLENGCISIHMDICKKNEGTWNSSEKEMVISTLRSAIKSSMELKEESVDIDMTYIENDPNCVNLVIDVCLLDQNYSHLLNEEYLTDKMKQLALQYVSQIPDDSSKKKNIGVSDRSSQINQQVVAMTDLTVFKDMLVLHSKYIKEQHRLYSEMKYYAVKPESDSAYGSSNEHLDDPSRGQRFYSSHDSEDSKDPDIRPTKHIGSRKFLTEKGRPKSWMEPLKSDLDYNTISTIRKTDSISTESSTSREDLSVHHKSPNVSVKSEDSATPLDHSEFILDLDDPQTSNDIKNQEPQTETTNINSKHMKDTNQEGLLSSLKRKLLRKNGPKESNYLQS